MSWSTGVPRHELDSEKKLSFRGIVSRLHTTSCRNALIAVVDAIQASQGSIRRTLIEADDRGDGTLPKSTVINVLRSHGLQIGPNPLSTFELKTFLRPFEKGNDESIGYDELLRFVDGFAHHSRAVCNTPSVRTQHDSSRSHVRELLVLFQVM